MPDESTTDLVLLRRVGALVAEARRARGWTQHALADALGVTRFTVINLERGLRGTHADTLLRAAALLDLLAGTPIAAAVKRGRRPPR